MPADMKLEDRTPSYSLGILTASNQNLICPVLIAELGSIAFPGFLIGSARRLAGQGERERYEFDGDLLVVQEVGALENDTKGAFTDLLAHTVVDTHYV